MEKRPDRILGRKISLDTGIVYLSESVSKFSFEQPNKVSEVMVSSKVSGDAQGFSFNRASDFKFNAYSKSMNLNMEREFISPISNQAFLFYDYEWLGFFEEGGKLINKIRLLPKRSTDPTFEGLIYIVEDEWRIHSIDLLITKRRGLEFVDSLKINQVFAPAAEGIWMPLSQKFSFKFGLLGFKGSGYYIGLYSNYQIEPNYDLFRKLNLYDSLFSEEEEKDLFEKNDFTTEVLLVESESNKKDSDYWQRVRPIQLTKIEVEDYALKDSIRSVKESKPYKDSVDAVKNIPTLGNIFLSGYEHSKAIKERYWSVPSILGFLQYNTVEGFVPEIKPTFRKEENRRIKYWIRPAMRYGFSNNRFNAKLEGSYRKLDKKFTQYYAGGGRYTSQFNEKAIISPLINSSLTLLSGDNYLKFFEKSFGYVGFEQEVKNGIFFRGNLEYASRQALPNTTTYSWARTKKLNFTRNAPANEELSDTGFAPHQALIATATLRFRIKQTYESRPEERIIFPSKYPEFTLIYKKAINAFSADLKYDFIALQIQDDISFGLVGKSIWKMAGGSFLNKSKLTFVDFMHFSGNETYFRRVSNHLNFQLLPFYRFSTSKPFFEGHYEHHFNEFIFNKIPLVKKLNLQAVASLNYLYTDTIGNYLELGAGIEHIFKFLRVDYLWAFRKGNFFERGIRLGIGF